MAEIKIVPFQADQIEHEAVDTLPTNTVAADAIANAVPKFQEWTIGKLFAEYGNKDGLLIYHLYNTDRKTIFDSATKKLDETKNAEDRQVIAKVANDALGEVPWWPSMQPCIVSAIKDLFRDTPYSAKYIPEVDSWSVTLAVDALPLGMQRLGHISAFVLNLAKRLGQIPI